MHNQLKANPKSRYYQGNVDPSTCKKYVGEGVITYRSSWEKKFIQWLETSSRVTRWSSENIRIPYWYVDGREHSYYPDFTATIDGEDCVIEIKPRSQCTAPKKPTPYSLDQWRKNSAKWSAALEWCRERGLKFKILTEESINKL